MTYQSHPLCDHCNIFGGELEVMRNNRKKHGFVYFDVKLLASEITP
jgi:hypothetical protein